jgi:hypothetical protein
MKYIPEELFPFRQIPAGSVFYIAKHQGNVYQKIDASTAEFIVHRLGPQFKGCRITLAPSHAVLRQPLTPEELDFLGIDPEGDPFNPRWTPPEGYDLLSGTTEDFSKLLDTNDDEDLLS